MNHFPFPPAGRRQQRRRRPLSGLPALPGRVPAPASPPPAWPPPRAPWSSCGPVRLGLDAGPCPPPRRLPRARATEWLDARVVRALERSRCWISQPGAPAQWTGRAQTGRFATRSPSYWFATRSPSYWLRCRFLPDDVEDEDTRAWLRCSSPLSLEPCGDECSSFASRQRSSAEGNASSCTRAAHTACPISTG